MLFQPCWIKVAGFVVEGWAFELNWGLPGSASLRVAAMILTSCPDAKAFQEASLV